MVAQPIPMPPLLSLVQSSASAPLTIPPAPKLAIVPRSQPKQDIQAVQAWVIRLGSLWAGDALVLSEYKICCVLAQDGKLEYLVFGACTILKVRAYEQVARWLVNDGQRAANAAYVDGDATAVRLSYVENVL